MDSGQALKCSIIMAVLVILLVFLLHSYEKYTVSGTKSHPIIQTGNSAPIKLGWIDYPGEKHENYEVKYGNHPTVKVGSNPPIELGWIDYPSEKFLIKNGKYDHGKLGWVDAPSMRCGLPGYGQSPLVRNVASYPWNGDN
jgi:hypothetical protein